MKSLILVFMLVIGPLSINIRANVANNHKWYEIPFPESSDGGIRISSGGRLSYFSKSNNRLSAWTASLKNGTSVNWVRIASETSDEQLLYNDNWQLQCTDDKCYFLSFSKGKTSLMAWVASSPASIHKIAEVGEMTNLGSITRLESLIIDRDNLFLFAEIGQSGLGIYKLSSPGIVTLSLPQSSTDIFNWDRQRMLIKNEVMLLVAKRRIKNIDRHGLFLIDLKTGRLSQLVIEGAQNGILTTYCCFMESANDGFLVQFETRQLPNSSRSPTMSNLIFVDQNGITKPIAQGEEINLPGITIYGVRWPGPSWNDLFLFVRSRLVDNERFDTLISKNKSNNDEVGQIIAETGSGIYPNGSVDGFGWSATTSDNKRVVQTFSRNGSLAVARLAFGVQPSNLTITPAVARPNDIITIRGSNLLIGDMKVGVNIADFFAEISGSPTTSSLNFRVPASISSGDYEVKLNLQDSTGNISISAGKLSIVNNYPLPAITANGIVNAGGFKPGPVAPGEIASLFGQNLTSEAPTAATKLPLPTTLASSRILIDGQPAPLYFVSKGQVNFQVPYTISVNRPVSVQVETRANDGTVLFSQPVSMNTSKVAPGFFEHENLAIVTDEKFQLVGRNNPVASGKTFALWLSGLGLTSMPIIAGEGAPSAEPLARVSENVIVKIGGVEVPVLFAGLAPGFAGLYQVNAQVPPGTPAGEQWLELTVGNAERIVTKIPVSEPEPE